MRLYYLSLAISILANCASLILLKQGMVAVGHFTERLNELRSWISLVFNPYVLFGVALFAASFVTWMIALAKIDLSLAYPTVSVTYAVIAVVSYFLFGESLPWNRLVGIGVVILGIVVMYIK
jgi:multidrug transporter EmrE-like cation transporter